MLILTGNNLGERHRDFNAKITAAVDNKINFDEVKSQDEKCDVDKLFKIELASRYKNIDYILEVLKSGDVFHITRALKSSWIYSDEYSNYVNVSYLENNIFPFMSKKMKRKMLTSISMNLRNGERAIEFYKYCKEAKMTEYAFKFLVYTTDKFKMSLMRGRFDSFRESKYLKQFIGKSIALARAYMSLYSFDNTVLHELRYLYSVSSEEEYLDNLEVFNDYNTSSPYCPRQLGIRISRNILKKHKNRVIKQPDAYIGQLNKNMLIRYLTSGDIKALLPVLLPFSPEDFWRLNFYKYYKFLIDKIPRNELFSYLKEIFNSKYHGESFELHIEFYKLGYFEMLTTDEQEAWALHHIERDRDLPGIENFMWYKFVSFCKAFTGIKRYIFLTPDKDKRSRIINILPKTVRNQDDLAKMLDYYYERHVNENEEHKESFINKIFEHHDIYSFNDECWTLLDRLFYSLDVYSTAPTIRQKFKIKSLIYRILHDKELPEALQEYLKYDKYPSAIHELSKQQTNIIINYLLNFHADKTKSITYQSSEESIKDDNELRKPFPESSDTILTQKRVKSNVDIQTNQENIKKKSLPSTEGDFLRLLKIDIQMVTEGISEIKSNGSRSNFKLCRLFRKLNVYFPNDVGKYYLEYFIKYLSNIPNGCREYRNIKMAVVGVFYLADEDYKKEFLEKYVPESPKINYKNIDRRVLRVQKAICLLAHHSRPPLPSFCIRKYTVGDYVHYCSPMFNHYLANGVCVKDLTKSLLDAPLSVVKHGLRLAFKCYNAETLNSLTIEMWKKTSNVSLRKLLYQTLFKRMLKENDEDQTELYKVLKFYTTELKPDDHDEVYSLLVSEAVPYQFKGDFIQTAWIVVSKFSDEALNLTRKTSVIGHIDHNIIYYVEREFIRLKIIDDHIHDMLFARNIKRYYDTDEIQKLIDAKWSLTIKYLVTFDHGEGRDGNKIEQERSLELLRTIMIKCIELWNHIDENVYWIRGFVQDFIDMIMGKDPMTIERCGYMVPIYKCILDVLQESLKKEEIYLISWKLKLNMVFRKIIQNGPEMSVKEICYKFGKKVGKLIMELVEKDEFYHCFYQSMTSIVNKIGFIICDYCYEGHTTHYYFMSDGLTEVKINETHVIAIMLLPRDDCLNWGDEHATSIRKIRKYDSKQIRSFLYEKYVTSDNRVRDYLYD